MNQIVAIPIELRLLLLFVLGTILGQCVNWACYRLAWRPRAISPWSARLPQAPPRSWADRLPILGWFGLRREAGLHGSAFWLRPLAVELGMGLFAAWLYWWVAYEGRLLPFWLGAPPAGVPLNAQPNLVVHCEYLAEMLLVALMTAASLIDVDEQIIPDTITVPGTLAGLALALVFPWSLLPAGAWQVPGGLGIEFLRATTPNAWPVFLDEWPGLLLALACWTAWCLAIVPLRWYGRHGRRRALGLVAARLVRHPYSWLAPIGWPVWFAAWWFAPVDNWDGLLTAFMGLVGGGAVIWAVRIVGKAVLKREAMGFGDVTLMAMIGTFVGWQSCLMIFFLAPFAGLVVGSVQWVLHRNQEIPYGPFLCLGTLVVIVAWGSIWPPASGVFGLGWLVPAMMGICMLLLAVLLGIWQVLRRALFGQQE